MRTAVISDIHANLEALQAVLAALETIRPDEIVCLGDSVGYNASPNECVELLRERHIRCILGNHDVVAAGLEEPDNFTPLAHTAILWTRAQLTDSSRQFLLGLPREDRVRGFLLMHGSINDTNRYLLSREDAAYNFRLMDGLEQTPLLGFFGHTHIRAVFGEAQGVISRPLQQEELALEPGKRYLINPGSVGQPRDADPAAAFLVYDDREARIVFRRVPYDIRRCQERILSAGLPQQLAERLAWGR